MSDNQINKILQDQFNRSWDMLQQAIAGASDTLWSTVGVWMFSMNVYHVIETVEFYGKKDPEDMEWGKRVGIDWKKDSKQELTLKKSRITKVQMNDYLDEIKTGLTGY